MRWRKGERVMWEKKRDEREGERWRFFANYTISDFLLFKNCFRLCQTGNQTSRQPLLWVTIYTYRSFNPSLRGSWLSYDPVRWRQNDRHPVTNPWPEVQTTVTPLRHYNLTSKRQSNHYTTLWPDVKTIMIQLLLHESKRPWPLSDPMSWRQNYPDPVTTPCVDVKTIVIQLQPLDQTSIRPWPS